MSGAILSLPQYTFMVWCSVEAQGQLYIFCMKDEKYICVCVCVCNIA